MSSSRGSLCNVINMSLFSGSKHWSAVALAIFLACCLAAFWPLFSADYLVNLDDNTHFLRNPLIVGKGFRDILQLFSYPDSVNLAFIPVTMLSFLLEHIFFGQNPFVSHLINFILHLGVCAVAFVFARRLGLTVLAAMAAIFVFALHPLHVEPVAWVASRKDLLYSFFYLASLYFYSRYVDGAGGRDYVISLVFAGLSIMSKPMALSLPGVLFLVDYIRARPWSMKLVLDKFPFFFAIGLLSAVSFFLSSFLTAWPAFSSPLLWIWCGTYYLPRFLWPLPVSFPFLPNLPPSWFDPNYLGAVLIFLLVLLLTWRYRAQRIVVFAVGWYVLSSVFLWCLMPAAFHTLADRFIYLPSLGFCLLLGVGWDLWMKRSQGHKRMAVILGIAILVATVFLANVRSSDWRTPYRLWTAIINDAAQRRAPGDHLAVLLRKRAETIVHEDGFLASRNDLERMMRSSHGGPDKVWDMMGRSSYEQKLRAFKFTLALRDLKLALFLAPHNVDLHYALGIAFFTMRNYTRSEFYLSQFLAQRHWGPSAFQIMGYNYEQLGRAEEALIFYNKASASGEMIPSIFERRAKLYHRVGRPREALSDAITWLGLKPDDHEMYDFAVARALEINDVRTAEELAHKGVRSFPGNPFAYVGRARVYLHKGDCAGFLSELKKARELGFVPGREEEALFSAQCP